MALSHPFLDGTTRRLFIGGQWVDARSGETFDCINPSTGEVLTRVSRGGKDDIDAAVAAAREAFTGEWSRLKPLDRQNLMHKVLALIEGHPMRRRIAVQSVRSM